jgi:hypothetical protein
MPEESDPRVEEVPGVRGSFAGLILAPCSIPAELICYGDIPEWWPQCRARLSAKDREILEGKLVFWLRATHHAETFKDPAKLPESSLQELNIVANCLECHGTGRSLGQERCRYRDGGGTVWVIVSRKQV